MAKKIQHLRGTPEEYLQADITPLAGELALEEGEDGATRIKVGDGKTPYLSLPYLTDTVIVCTPERDGSLSLTPRHGHDYRAGGITALTLALPEKIREDYRATVVFDTGLTPPSVSYPKELVFYGDGCEGGLFFPEAHTRYTLSLEYRTGVVYAGVHGVSHDLAYKSYYEVGEERLPYICAVEVDRADKILDISLEGYLGFPDTDGFVSGLGTYDYESNQFILELIWQNGCIMEYEDLLSHIMSAGEYVIGKLDVREEENGLSILANATSSATVVSTATAPLASGFGYRLRASLVLTECEDTFTIGESIPSPFKIFYGTQSEVVPMTYLGDGRFAVDYTSNTQKAMTKIFCTSIGRAGRLLIEKNGFSLVATKGSYEAEAKKQRASARIPITTPLRAADTVKDSLSLTSATVTRRINAQLLGSFYLNETQGEISVFGVNLPQPMHVDYTGELSYFTRCYSYEELLETPLGFYFDPFDGNGILYFSGDYGIYDESAMSDWIFENYEVIGYAYPLDTPTVERVTLHCALVPYEGYTFLMLKGATQSTFLVTRYTNEEKGEENYEDVC